MNFIRGAIFPPAAQAYRQYVERMAKEAVESITTKQRKTRLQPPPVPSWRRCLLDQIEHPIKHLDFKV